MPIWAHIESEAGATNRRRAPRQQLRLDATSTPTMGEAARVAIRDLSLDGFLMETSGRLRVGQELEVDLPEAGLVRAEVMWSGGHYFGCRFKHPIPKAALSAALLRSEPDVADERQSAGELSSNVGELQLLRAEVQRVAASVDYLTDRLRKNVDARHGRSASETEVADELLGPIRQQFHTYSRYLGEKPEDARLEDDNDDRLPLQVTLLMLFLPALLLWLAIFWLVGLI